jgi:hypothetical protein
MTGVRHHLPLSRLCLFISPLYSYRPSHQCQLLQMFAIICRPAFVTAPPINDRSLSSSAAILRLLPLFFY